MSTFDILNDGANRDAWLGARLCGVGASEVPILFGCGYEGTSELGLYLQKIGEGESIEATEGMNWGKKLEHAIIEELAERAGFGSRGEDWYGNRALLHNPAYPFLVCTPDGLTSLNEPIEVKNICCRVVDNEWDGSIPEKFMIQVQSQIAVCGASRGLFGALIFGGRLVWDWIPRDDVLIAEIDRRTRAFWAHVVDRDPPSSNGSSSARHAAIKLAKLSPPKELFYSEIEENLLQWERFKSQEAAAKDVARELESKRRAVEDELIRRMGSASEAFTSTGWSFRKTLTKRAAHYVKESVTEGFKIIPPKAESRV